MFEFLRSSLAAILCYRRKNPLTRSERQKHRSISQQLCRVNEKVKEETTSNPEIQRITNIRNDNRIEKIRSNDKVQQLEKVGGTVPHQQSLQQKLPPLFDKSTSCFVQVASFGTQTSEEWKFKKAKTIVSKATQTSLPTVDETRTSRKNESEERLKFQAWKDAKFFVTNQLLTQCHQTPNCTKSRRSTESYFSAAS